MRGVREEEMKRTTPNIMKAVILFRKGLIGKQTSRGACFMVCQPLRSYLRFSFGLHCRLVTGHVKHENSNHVWIELPNGTIIDPTADQFRSPTGETMPCVYIGKKPEWYEEGELE
jgi:hypothetical protein